MKTLRELNQKYWGRVHDMCKGTALEGREWECVKLEKMIMTSHPTFIFDPSDYEFAIAILEGKPVFVGDKYWLRHAKQWVTAELNDTIRDSSCSWTPLFKKRTFMLNGVELPCPINNGAGGNIAIEHRHSDGYVMTKHLFWFQDSDDTTAITKALLDILTKARDKE